MRFVWDVINENVGNPDIRERMWHYSDVNTFIKRVTGLTKKFTLIVETWPKLSEHHIYWPFRSNIGKIPLC